MIDPNLVKGLKEVDFEEHYKLAKKLCGNSASDDDIEEKVKEIQTLIMIVNTVGANYDPQKIKVILDSKKKLDKKHEEIFNHHTIIKVPEIKRTLYQINYILSLIKLR